MELKRLTGLRKRQQIEQANKTVFMAVAIASVVVAFSLVAAQFLFKQAAFNQKVISAKSQTNKTLENNIKVADQLKSEVNKLIANKDLSSARSQPADPEGNNLQVVLDALPTENDPTALTASFQHAILSRSGVSIENLSVTPVEVIESDAAGAAQKNEPSEMSFTMVLQGNYEQIRSALVDMEKVIRPIQLNLVTVQGTDNQLRASIEGVTYYLPAKTVNLTTKTIKP